ncbi:hypothetical protein PMSD_17225 [Paenibacillus macquariensis subsp. defensor]|nr:hypothetical protein PMSD_17225 [Paenibacillus macquariensis subsp. defensor]
MKVKTTVFFYSLAAIYIFKAIITIFTDFVIPVAFIAYVSVLAFLITIYDLTTVVYKITDKKSNKEIRNKVAYHTYLFFLSVTVIVSVAFLYYFMVTKDEKVITKIRNYATFGAIGVVFITYGYKMRKS